MERGKKGSTRWTDEVNEAVEEKGMAYKKILESNEREEVSEKWERNYRESRTLVKKPVRECKERVNEEFGRKITARQNKKT